MASFSAASPASDIDLAALSAASFAVSPIFRAASAALLFLSLNRSASFAASRRLPE